MCSYLYLKIPRKGLTGLIWRCMAFKWQVLINKKQMLFRFCFSECALQYKINYLNYLKLKISTVYNIRRKDSLQHKSKNPKIRHKIPINSNAKSNLT